MLRAVDDTDPKIAELLIEGYRSMSLTEKLERVQALTLAVRELALLDVRRRYPNAPQREQALMAGSRWTEPELMARAFGWGTGQREVDAG